MRDEGNVLHTSCTWTLPALALLVPLACAPGLGDPFDLPKLVLLEIGLALALLTLAGRTVADLSILRTPAAVAALLFLGVNAVATAFSVEPRTAFLGNYSGHLGLLTLAVFIGYFFLAASWVRTETALARLATGLVLAATANSLYVAVQYIGWEPLGWSITENRPTIGALGYANHVGEFLAMTMPLTVWLAWRERGLRRDLLLWSLALQLGALALTAARAAWATVLLQVLVVVPLAVAMRWRPWRHLGRVLAIAPPLAVLAAFVLLLRLPAAPGSLDVAARELPKGHESGSPLQARVEIWQSGVAALAERPVLGWGPDTFELVYPAYRSTTNDQLEAEVATVDTTHNVLLGVAVNAGVLGVAAYLAVVVAVWVVLLRSVFGADHTWPVGLRTAGLALLLAWSSYFVLFLVGRPRMTTEWLAWIIGGAVLGLFAVPGSRPRRLAGPTRVGLVALALVLLLDGGTQFVADAADGQGIRAARPESLPLAAAWLERAVAMRPFEPEYQHDLGLNLIALGRASGDATYFRAAVEHLGQAFRLSGQRDPSRLMSLAKALLEWEAATGQPTEAPLEYARQAIAMDPKNPLLYADGAELAARLERSDLAQQYWEAAQRGARSPDAFYRVGELALQFGDTTTARNAFRDAAAGQWRRPFQAEYYRAWGKAAFALGLMDEAAEAFAEVLARAPGDVATRLDRAVALAATGERATALLEAQRALEQAPGDQRATLLVNLLERS